MLQRSLESPTVPYLNPSNSTELAMLLSSLDSYLPFHTSYSPSFTYTDSMESQEVSQQKRGLWTEEEDKILMDYIDLHGKGKWNRVAKMTGLKRCGKSCRLRWINYLCPNLKKGDFSEEEEDLIIRLHKLLGNRWSLIAGRVPGRTDNQVKNHWNTSLSKKLGIKKEKMKLGVKQEQPSMDDNKQEKTEEMSAAPNPKVPCCEDNGGIVAVNEGCHGVFETSYSMKPLPNESLEDSFWFSDENLSLYGTSSFMELPDVYSPDTFWDDM